MKLEQFFSKEYRKQHKLKIPQLDIFQKKKHEKWSVSIINNEFNIKAYKKQNLVWSENLEKYLENILPKNAISCNNAITDYYTSKNQFIDELPIFIIRRHGNYSGENGGEKRRRGWLVRFDNAWIVYADNFLSRHFFEAAYLIDEVDSEQIRNLIISFSFPLSSGGGSFEKKHRAFPSINHLTARSGLYLSHIFDLNQNEYLINGVLSSAKDMLGRGSDNKFACGVIEDWDNGFGLKDKSFNYRVINSKLSREELAFLTAYNVRMLSPFNYFPFPKSSLLENTPYTGETNEIRKYCQAFYNREFQKDYTDFLQYACVQI